MKDEETIWDADFNPAVKRYWLLTGVFVLAAMIVGIPLIPFWLILGPLFTGRYLKSHRCTLTDRNLKVCKGVLTRIEKTIPLDRITDVGLIQGPLMRAMGIEVLRVETAGQSSAGALVGLAGIKDGRAFRDAVLKQRDLVAGGQPDGVAESHPTDAVASSNQQVELLKEISQTLSRIEREMKTRD